MQQKGLSRWLVGIGVLVGLTAAVFFYGLIPSVVNGFGSSFPEFRWVVTPSILVIVLSSVPFYFALLQYFMICSRISKDQSFSRLNAKALYLIGICALIDTVLCLALTLFLFVNRACNGGALIILLGVMAAGVFVAVLSMALSHLVEKASALKDENELTI